MLLLLTALILGVAAWFDIATRLIPDRCSVALLMVGIAERLALGPMAVVTSLGCAVLLGLFFLFLHARGVMGGGDVKLIVALAAGTAPLALWDLIFAIAMAGGVLSLIYLVLYRVAPRPALRPHAALPLRVIIVESNRIARRGPLPYGVAIAAGAIVAGLLGGDAA